MHYFKYLNEQFASSWNKPALSDYGQEGSTYTFGELAQAMLRLHALFRTLNVQPGDKIAIVGRNSMAWAVAYLAIASYKGVVVSILPDFTREDIAKLLEHSQSKMLFVGPYVWNGLNGELLAFKGPVVSLSDFTLLQGNDEMRAGFVDWKTKCANGTYGVVTREEFHLPEDGDKELALINYTSGSTGNPKGVMLNAASLCSNVEAGLTLLPAPKNATVVSILPLAHMFGQVAEFLYPLCTGCHIYFLAKTPTPAILMKALQEVKPYMLVMVPLVIEKIYQRNLSVRLSGKLIHALWNAPLIGHFIRLKVKQKLNDSFGGRIRYFLLGGAAVHPDVEDCLMDIRFPLLVGYGMTECGPLIGGCRVKEFRRRSCGRAVPNVEVRINNPNAEGVGEVWVRGTNVMMGYYRNMEATDEVFDAQGWLKTGDLGMMDKDGFIYLKGRKKTMFLNANGQNIYPEEIESKLNALDGVEESLIVERKGKLVALVFPEDKTKTWTKEAILAAMQENLHKLNKLIPNYSQVSDIEIKEDPFEKTPKKSIKRFLYN